MQRELDRAGGPRRERRAEERLDFLRQAIAFTEWTIRSFDTKAQISIAAFVLSMNPLWSILTSACPRAAASPFVVGLGKQAFYRQLEMPQDAAYAYAQEVMSLNALATDAQEGMGAFLEKRTASWVPGSSSGR